MGVRYTGKSQSGYNTNPPSDTPGDTSGTNQVEWAKHKQKLSDPVLALSNDINAALLAQFDQGPVPISVNTTTNAANYNQVLEVTGTTTISLMTAATATKGYVAMVKNAGVGVVTVDLATPADSLDGTVNGTLQLQLGESLAFIVNDTASGYISLNSNEYLKTQINTINANAAFVNVANAFIENQTIQKDNPVLVLQDTSGIVVGDVKVLDAAGNTRGNFSYNEVAGNPGNTFTSIITRDNTNSATSRILAYEDGKAVMQNDVSLSFVRINAAGSIDITGFSNQDITLTPSGIGSVVLNNQVSGTAVLDEDNMVSDSAVHLATQQSIKAYVDGAGLPAHTHPLSDITDSGTMAPQNSNAVSITGGSITGVTGVSLTGHTHTLANITDSGSMAAQNSGAVSITGGSISGVTGVALDSDFVNGTATSNAGNQTTFDTGFGDDNFQWGISGCAVATDLIIIGRTNASGYQTYQNGNPQDSHSKVTPSAPIAGRINLFYNGTGSNIILYIWARRNI